MITPTTTPPNRYPSLAFARVVGHPRVDLETEPDDIRDALVQGLVNLASANCDSISWAVQNDLFSRAVAQRDRELACGGPCRCAGCLERSQVSEESPLAGAGGVA